MHIFTKNKICTAHRGAPSFAHENTIASFATAISQGADMVECDIRRTNDGELVVFHDPDITEGTVRVKLSEISYPTLVSIGVSHGYAIPRMEQMLASLQGKVSLLIELKEGGYERVVIECALRYFDPDSLLFQSFEPSILTTITTRFPHLKTGLLVADANILQYNQSTGAAFYALHHSVFFENQSLVERFIKEGVKIAVWTVDDPDMLKELYNDKRVWMIITNRIDMLTTMAQQRVS